MGFNARQENRPRRTGGALIRSRAALLVSLLLLILVVTAIHLGGGTAGDSPPGHQAHSDLNQRDQASVEASASQAQATRAASDQAGTGPARELQPVQQFDQLLADEDEAARGSEPGPDRDQDPDADRSAPIHGSVLDDAGEPLPDRVVTAERLGSTAGGTTAADRASAITDRLGMFRFKPLPEGEYLLRVAEDEAFHAGRLNVRVGVSAAEIYLQRKGSIKVSGQVRNPQAEPLAQVRVRSLGGRQSTVSDQSGFYDIEIERVKAGTAPVLEFRHVDHQDVRERIDEAGSDPVWLDVVMPGRSQTVSVSGWVSGPASEPVAGADVWLSSASPHASHRTRTDALGAYEFQRVESGDHYRLGVDPSESHYQRYVSQPQAIGSDPVHHDVRLKKAGDAELSGVLVDPQGRPLPGFGIWLRQLEAGAPAPVFIQTDQRGQFPPVTVRSGSLRLETHSSPQLAAGGIQLATGESRFLQIPLDWGSRWLMGQVVDDSDRPVQQAEVVVQWRIQEPEVISSSRRTARVDQDGFFSFANLGAAYYQLTVSAPGFQTRRIQVSPAVGDELLIPMQRQATSAGGSP